MTPTASPTFLLLLAKSIFNNTTTTTTATTRATTMSAAALRAQACFTTHQYDSLKILYIISMVCVLMLGLIGNSIVILAVIKSQVLNSRPTFRFAASLAVSDMIMALSQIPLRILYVVHDRHFCYSLTMCYVRQFTDYVGSIASILNLFFISLDRFVAIEYPLRYLQEVTKRRCSKALLFIWTFAFTWAISGMFPWKGTKGVTLRRRCYNADRLFLYISYFGLYAPILFVVTCFYAEILHIAIGQIRRLERINSQVRRPSSPPTPTPTKRKDSQLRQEMKPLEDINSGLRRPSSPRLLRKVSLGKDSQLRKEMKPIDEINSSIRRPSSPLLPRTSSKREDSQSRREMKRLESSSSSMRKSSSPRLPRTPSKRKDSTIRKEMKTTYSIFIVYLTFCMCWLPLAVILFIQLVDRDYFKDKANYTVLWFAVGDIFPAIITSINPIIYSFSNTRFRQGVKSIWVRELRRSSNSSSRIVSSAHRRWLQSLVPNGSAGSSANNSPLMIRHQRTGSYRPAQF